MLKLPKYQRLYIFLFWPGSVKTMLWPFNFTFYCGENYITKCTAVVVSVDSLCYSFFTASEFAIVNTPPFAESITEGDVRWEKGL